MQTNKNDPSSNKPTNRESKKSAQNENNDTIYNPQHQLVSISTKNDFTSNPGHSLKVLPEEDFVSKLDEIVQKSFFPSLVTIDQNSSLNSIRKNVLQDTALNDRIKKLPWLYDQQQDSPVPTISATDTKLILNHPQKLSIDTWKFKPKNSLMFFNSSHSSDLYENKRAPQKQIVYENTRLPNVCSPLPPYFSL
ncbi:hypothetical protein AYI69_g9249 [Smittium culicis]|uniref:Uncharacterized protein n=1 Tax=Smittium culicis TaxID=133412 RepID=A0A1R1XE13_9FUNG|nr:hypothetical protein AYI69_g9843 [Smittium culicis]OMJ12833.1 hypothetical protein AYI69_g9249 [Smittium culicis]